MSNKFILGTAQFGLNYGINNSSGKPHNESVYEIMNMCLENNIKYIDSANAYGDAEKILGNYNRIKDFNIITKVTFDNYEKLKENIFSTFSSLKIENLHAMLFHSFNDVKDKLEIFEKIKKDFNKSIKNVGISLYKPNELKFLLDNNVPFDIIQVPYNIFDRRFESFKEILKVKNIEIHTRSIFLQGLIFMKNYPEYFLPYKFLLDDFSAFAVKFRISKLQCALHFVLQSSFPDKIVIGIDNIYQLKQIINFINNEVTNIALKDFDNFKSSDEKFLLPYKWKI